VIGLGRMGQAVLRDLMESDEVREIVAADIHIETHACMCYTVCMYTLYNK